VGPTFPNLIPSLLPSLHFTSEHLIHASGDDGGLRVRQAVAAPPATHALPLPHAVSPAPVVARARPTLKVAAGSVVEEEAMLHRLAPSLHRPRALLARGHPCRIRRSKNWLLGGGKQPFEVKQSSGEKTTT
jgi:hypothetical protein